LVFNQCSQLFAEGGQIKTYDFVASLKKFQHMSTDTFVL